MPSSHKQIISFGAPPANPYSVAVKAGGFIYLSGTLAEDTGDPSAPSDVGSETRRTIERMRDVLVAAGSSLDDVVAVMDALGIEKAHVVGHSMGALTALHVGIRYPQRCLSVTAAGCGGVGGPWDPIRNSRIPWTAVTRSLMTPLICSGV